MRNRAVREQLYKAYLNRARRGNEYDSTDIAQQIIRCELKANLLGAQIMRPMCCKIRWQIRNGVAFLGSNGLLHRPLLNEMPVYWKDNEARWG